MMSQLEKGISICETMDFIMPHISRGICLFLTTEQAIQEPMMEFFTTDERVANPAARLVRWRVNTPNLIYSKR